LYPKKYGFAYLSHRVSLVPRALIASSNAEVAAMLCVTLEREGFECHRTQTDESTLREAHGLLPDVVMVHHDLDGFTHASEVAGVLARRAELQHAWVVALVPLEHATAYHAAGLEAIEPEPFDPERFLARLGTVRKSRQATLDLTHRLEFLEREHRDLLQVERNKDKLTQTLVHDFKNPINTVITSIEEMVELHGPRLPGPAASLLQLAQDEAQHLLHLAANILDVRKMQAGKLRLVRGLIAPNVLTHLLELALSDVGGPLRRQVRFNVPSNLPNLDADSEVLRRVFANLMSNAIKHTERTGQIQVTARVDTDTIEIVFQDDGEGIPEEDLETVFQTPERSNATTSTRFDTGMGLTFCKVAVEAHGGEIWVESEPGFGSRFIIRLSLRSPQEEIVDLVD
jgi:signal transduction histidine kinase